MIGGRCAIALLQSMVTRTARSSSPSYFARWLDLDRLLPRRAGRRCADAVASSPTYSPDDRSREVRRSPHEGRIDLVARHAPDSRVRPSYRWIAGSGRSRFSAWEPGLLGVCLAVSAEPNDGQMRQIDIEPARLTQ